MSRWNKVRYVLVLGALLIAPATGYAIAPDTSSSGTGGDVVVDGGWSFFGPGAEIHDLTIKNGGMVFALSAVITGDVTVEDEYSYVNLMGASVDGDVIVRDGGVLDASGATIAGNLLGQGFAEINFMASSVEENIQLKNGGNFYAVVGTCDVGGNVHITKCGVVNMVAFTVDGNVQISKCVSSDPDAGAEVTDCTIDGKLQVFSNAIAGGIVIEGNAIGGNLTTRDNKPAATVSDNDVEGKRSVK